MENQTAHTGKRPKNRACLLTMRQSLSVRPRYTVYRGGMQAVYTVEGDITRHVYAIRKDGAEVMKLRKKRARLLPAYTLEKDGHEIAQIKKRISLLTHDLCGTFGDLPLEIRPDWDAYRFDILLNGRKLCRIEQNTAGLSDSYAITVFDESMETLAVALAVICDRVSDSVDHVSETD